MVENVTWYLWIYQPLGKGKSIPNDQHARKEEYRLLSYIHPHVARLNAREPRQPVHDRAHAVGVEAIDPAVRDDGEAQQRPEYAVPYSNPRTA